MRELRAFSRAASQAYKIPPPAAKPRIQPFLPYFGSRDMRFREVFKKIKKFFEINHEWCKKKNIKPPMDPRSRRARAAIRGFLWSLVARKRRAQAAAQKQVPSTATLPA